MPTLIDLVCENPLCGKAFQRTIGEFNRNKKRKRRQYCSLACSCQDRNIKGELGSAPENRHDISQYCGNLNADGNSAFRTYLRRSRHRKCGCDLTVEDLKDQWETQKGICPYTGLKLRLCPHTKAGYAEYKKTPKLSQASLDRIDSSKPYTRDNIQFVSTMANYAKSDLSHEEMLKFCRAIANNFSLGAN